MHRSGEHDEDDRLTVALADLDRGLLVRREMDVLPALRPETLRPDRFEEPRGRAVEQPFRRDDRRKTEVDLDRVPLAGADARAVRAEREALLVVRRDHLIELLAGDRFPRPRRCRE